MSSSSQTLIQQTKAYVSDTFTAVKDVLGFETHPQSKVFHNREYLNDIARGNWKSLNHVSNCCVKNYPVVGFPEGFNWYHKDLKFKTGVHRCPFLEEVKLGSNLKHVKTVDKGNRCWWGEKGYKYNNGKGNRRELMKEIRSFSAGDLKKSGYDQEFLNDISRGKWRELSHVPTEEEQKRLLKEIEMFSKRDLNKVPVEGEIGFIEQAKEFMEDKYEQVKEVFGLEIHPQGKVEHDKPFLNDIAKGNWEKLNHVNVCERECPVVGVEGNLGWKKDVKIKKNNNVRKDLLNEVKQGCDLNHVKTVEKNELRLGSDYRLKRGVDRKQLLNEIQEFEGYHLSHVGSS